MARFYSAAEHAAATIQANLAAFAKYDNTFIDNIIYQHYERLSSFYVSNKLFYKTILKNNKFLLSNFILTEYYTTPFPALSEINKKFMPLNMMSKNSVATFFNFLVISSRLTVSRSTMDSRKIIYSITDKLNQEFYKLIDSMLSPLLSALPPEYTRHRTEDLCLRQFFTNISHIIYNKLFHFDDIQHADIFITKDAGHSIILSLFCGKEKINSTTYHSLSVTELSACCGVSRSHIKKIISQAAQVGFILNPSHEKRICLTENFCHFVRLYMKKYFAFCMLGGGLSTNPDDHRFLADDHSTGRR